MLKIPEVTMLDVAFGSNALDLMPAMKDIPKDYPNQQKWIDIMNRWFFEGLKGATFVPKPGGDQKKALATIAAVLRSFAPRHEHKEAAVAYMLSEWFEDVILEPKKEV